MKPDQGVESGGGNIGTAFTYMWDKDLHGSLMSEKKGVVLDARGGRRGVILGKRMG